MIKYILDVLHSTNSKNFILQHLILIAGVALMYHLYKTRNENEFMENIEGFTQEKPFVLKIDQAVYDELYATVYDVLTKMITRSNWELENILKMTQADKNNSVFLDVGSASGYKLDELRKKGYRAVGVEKSVDMIARSEMLFPEIMVKHGDVFDPMLFERSIFTHVLCVNYTIYEFENKLQFFRNCYFWMMPNAYLIVHLVDPLKFNAVVPVGKNKWMEESKRRRKPLKGRITDTLVEFYDFDYHAHYEFPVEKENNRVIFTQKIKDKKTKNIRENEQTLYMDSINDILKMASLAGFIFHGKADMKELNQDENQYLYVLERTM
jgi:hypothetical protein